MDISLVDPITVAQFVILIDNRVDEIVIYNGINPDDKNRILFEHTYRKDTGDVDFTYLKLIPEEILNKHVTQVFMDEFGTWMINVGERCR